MKASKKSVSQYVLSIHAALKTKLGLWCFKLGKFEDIFAAQIITVAMKNKRKPEYEQKSHANEAKLL